VVALVAGVVLGGTGLAAADVLPGPVQGAVNDTLAKVGVGGHGGPERYKGPECDASKGDYRNHGQYVKLHKTDAAAARSRCGKPIQAGQDNEKPESAKDEAKPANGPCQGPPPWAGKGAGKDKAAKAAAQAERRASCGDDEGEKDEEPEAKPPSTSTSVPALVPTTTVPTTTVPATTTTAAPSTTTLATTTTQP
jgi:hypothetical protein